MKIVGALPLSLFIGLLGAPLATMSPAAGRVCRSGRLRRNDRCRPGDEAFQQGPRDLG